VRLLVLQHIACEHPGAFREVLRERGVDWTAVELDEGERLPAWPQFDGVVAMGGPMGANDEAAHPWIEEEKQLIAEAVDAGLPFLGVCLGAQLLAAAFDAGVWTMPAAEVGLLPVERTEAGRDDPVLGPLAAPLVSLQWHGDTFDLPRDAVRLASSPAAPNQAFRLGDKAYAVQFHLEVTPEMVDAWAQVPAYSASLDRTLGPDAGAAFLREAAARAPAMAGQARTLFGGWLDVAAAG
jgi:GMP synthase (glutamine-hydrolysing)